MATRNSIHLKKLKNLHDLGMKGFSLIELMIAIFLLTFGLLGFAALQGQALRATGTSGSATTANMIVRDAADRILRNAENVGAYNAMNTRTGARPNCPVINPTPVCAQDFTDWQNAVAALPQGVLQITTTPGANFDAVAVTVQWQDPMGSHTVVQPIEVAP